MSNLDFQIPLEPVFARKKTKIWTLKVPQSGFLFMISGNSGFQYIDKFLMINPDEMNCFGGENRDLKSKIISQCVKREQQ